jgi:hypothetical protein
MRLTYVVVLVVLVVVVVSEYAGGVSMLLGKLV